MREFLFFFIEKLSELADSEIKIEHSFKDTREKIEELFEYIDCDHGGNVQAGEMYYAVKFFTKVEKFRDFNWC
jgi:Ca2+-binding EF-hand superfamily protein